MAIYSSILAWRIPRTEEPGGLQSIGSQSQTRPNNIAHAYTHMNISRLIHKSQNTQQEPSEPSRSACGVVGDFLAPLTTPTHLGFILSFHAAQDAATQLLKSLQRGRMGVIHSYDEWRHQAASHVPLAWHAK